MVRFLMHKFVTKCDNSFLFTALSQKIPQMNNFVIYDGFFASQESQKDGSSAHMHITAR